MESSSSSTSVLLWNYLNLLLLRPILAISFVLSFILLGWFLAWKLILVHVPLIQDIFGLRKKPIKPKPPSRGRFTKFYNFNNSIQYVNSTPDCAEQLTQDQQEIKFHEFLHVWKDKESPSCGNCAIINKGIN